MTKDDIIRMAREAGVWDRIGYPAEIERFAALVAAAEREACAKVCEEWLHGNWHNQGVVAAMMIRARGAA
jgi:hypothetical protein